jgi:hypothetical protein
MYATDLVFNNEFNAKSGSRLWKGVSMSSPDIRKLRDVPLVSEIFVLSNITFPLFRRHVVPNSGILPDDIH